MWRKERNSLICFRPTKVPFGSQVSFSADGTSITLRSGGVVDRWNIVPSDGHSPQDPRGSRSPEPLSDEASSLPMVLVPMPDDVQTIPQTIQGRIAFEGGSGSLTRIIGRFVAMRIAASPVATQHNRLLSLSTIHSPRLRRRYGLVSSCGFWTSFWHGN